jgi:hypothetical protein
VKNANKKIDDSNEQIQKITKKTDLLTERVRKDDKDLA